MVPLVSRHRPRELRKSPIAKIINEHFVPVKVDATSARRDSRYQSAISAISGQGGWPLTGFLMPDGKPFLAAPISSEDQVGRRFRWQSAATPMRRSRGA